MRRQTGGLTFPLRRGILNGIASPFINRSLGALENNLHGLISKKVKNKKVSAFLKNQLKSATPFVKDIVKDAIKKQAGGRRRRRRRRRHRKGRR